MKVTYVPEEGEIQSWEFLPRKVLDDAAEAVEVAFGDTWDSFLGQLMKGGVRARRVLLWHLQCREHPSLRIADMPKFSMAAMEVEFDVEELLEFRVRMVAAPIDEATRTTGLAWLDAELADRGVDQDAAGAPAGKAPQAPKAPRAAAGSKSVGSRTRSTSRST